MDYRKPPSAKDRYLNFYPGNTGVARYHGYAILAYTYLFDLCNVAVCAKPHRTLSRNTSLSYLTSPNLI